MSGDNADFFRALVIKTNSTVKCSERGLIIKNISLKGKTGISLLRHRSLLTQVTLSSWFYICSRWTQAKFNVDWINEQNYWFHCYCNESQEFFKLFSCPSYSDPIENDTQKGPWLSSGQDSKLPRQRAQVWELVWKLRSCMMHEKKEKEKKRAQHHSCSILHKTIESSSNHGKT